MTLTSGGADKVKVLIAQAGYGKFRADGAFVGKQVCQHNAADFSRHPIGEDTVQPVLSAGAVGFELGHWRHLKKADRIPHCPAFGADMRH